MVSVDSLYVLSELRFVLEGWGDEMNRKRRSLVSKGMSKVFSLTHVQKSATEPSFSDPKIIQSPCSNICRMKPRGKSQRYCFLSFLFLKDVPRLHHHRVFPITQVWQKTLFHDFVSPLVISEVMQQSSVHEKRWAHLGVGLCWPISHSAEFKESRH